MSAANPESPADRVQSNVDDVARDVSAANTARPVEREVPRPRYDGSPADAASERAALFEPAVLNDFNTRWSEVQTGFVDEPRSAVQRADALVSDVINRIGDSFSRERAQLEQQWDRGGDVSTEDLRLALQRYRSFFSRLLTL
jgi:hypothetical protein